MPWLILLIILLIAVPIVCLIELVVCLIRYRHTPKDALELRRKYRVRMIVAGAILGMVAAAWIALMILFASAITHM